MAEYSGLYQKYEVKRVDGRDAPGEKHENDCLFVLDVTHDPAARKAMRQYARSCERTRPVFSSEILGLLGRHEPCGYVCCDGFEGEQMSR